MDKGNYPNMLRMILIHNSIARATAKDGKPVKAMQLSYDKGMLHNVMDRYKAKEGATGQVGWPRKEGRNGYGFDKRSGRPGIG
jgi:hypothetical protein